MELVDTIRGMLKDIDITDLKELNQLIEKVINLRIAENTRVNWSKELNEQYNIDITDEEAVPFVTREALLVIFSPGDKPFSVSKEERNEFKIFETILEMRPFLKGRTWYNTDVVSSRQVRWMYAGVPIYTSFD